MAKHHEADQTVMIASDARPEQCIYTSIIAGLIVTAFGAAGCGVPPGPAVQPHHTTLCWRALTLELPRPRPPGGTDANPPAIGSAPQIPHAYPAREQCVCSESRDSSRPASSSHGSRGSHDASVIGWATLIQRDRGNVAGAPKAVTSGQSRVLPHQAPHPGPGLRRRRSVRPARNNGHQ